MNFEYPRFSIKASSAIRQAVRQAHGPEQSRRPALVRLWQSGKIHNLLILVIFKAHLLCWWYSLALFVK